MEFERLGRMIRTARLERGYSAAVIAERVHVSAAYYSRIETGRDRPSRMLLSRIVRVLEVEPENRVVLEELAGYSRSAATTLWPQPLMAYKSEHWNHSKIADSPASVTPASPKPVSHFDPHKTPVLYTDAMSLNLSESGVVMDFSQSGGANAGHNYVIARLGMSYKQAREMYQLLGKELEKARDMKIEG